MHIKVKSFAYVLHPVTNVVRAREFYEDLLGLKVSMQIEFAPGKWWIEYDVAGQALAISNAYPNVNPVCGLTLEVFNLDAALATAKAGEAEIVSEIVEFPPCRSFFLKDPDGNQIGLHQLKPIH
jgi:predicted enzyme related to lactoylglutathione lyase